ncbi:jg7693 [Pararge aegeria aegeria]|uniref:Jg7693 protein n=1 Tax=Pararge aegeria aegeria TaxID=348720 RepID=A0A8S4RVC8_9NEOP|nr:jg7693 [Pararge aegeria aegeria]
MKLHCEVEVINRVHSSLNIRSNAKYLRSTLALGKEPKNVQEYFILHFSSVNKNGTKYKVKCMKQVFVKCLNEGRLPNISELYLSNNSLGLNKNSDWQWLLGLKISKKLKLLDLRENKIINLPKDIWKLQNLVTLKIDKNSLYKLPTTLGRITTLRYLSVSENNLRTLPCSLIRCGLEHLDISSNNFKSEADAPKIADYTPWDIYINSLVHIAAKTVLKHKFFYAPNIIPKTLVELLDNSNMCVCGQAVLNDKYYVIKPFELIGFSISRHIVSNFVNKGSSVSVECFFCSPKCFVK